MHHLHIDRYAGITSPVHAIDPRLKLTAALSFVLLVVLTPEEWLIAYVLYAILLAAVVLCSRVPVGYIAKRSLAILPFAIAVSFFIPFVTPGRTISTIQLFGYMFPVSTEGLGRFAALNAKAFVSFVMTFILVATTRFGDLMWAASRLGLPAKLVLVISFMYRYLFILLDKAAHMKLARELRSSRGHNRIMIAASGNIIGALFVRSFAHATMLYDAMLLRGFTGKPVSFTYRHIHVSDLIAATGFLLVAAMMCITGGIIHG